MKFSHFFSVYSFPVWAIIASLYALAAPDFLVSLKPYIFHLLVIVMLGMGMTLSLADFQKVLHQKKVVGLGISIQFLIMPFSAYLLALIFGLSTELTIGLMLVGATAGGTASNVMTYLANGDLALSVSMTLLSSFLAMILLPFWMWFYLSTQVDVPVLSMFMSLVKLILLPLAAGMLFNHFFHKSVKRIQPILPSISMMVIVLIVAIVVALNQSNLSELAFGLAMVVVLHNLIGLVSGYWITKRLGYDSKIARTVAIEVGMQNSGLSVALALKYFSPLAALPGAIFSIWHNLSGAIYAAYWKQRDHK